MDPGGADRRPRLCWAVRRNPTLVGPSCACRGPPSPTRDGLSPGQPCPRQSSPHPAHQAAAPAQGSGSAAQTRGGQDPPGGTGRAAPSRAAPPPGTRRPRSGAVSPSGWGGRAVEMGCFLQKAAVGNLERPRAPPFPAGWAGTGTGALAQQCWAPVRRARRGRSCHECCVCWRSSAPCAHALLLLSCQSHGRAWLPFPSFPEPGCPSPLSLSPAAGFGCGCSKPEPILSGPWHGTSGLSTAAVLYPQHATLPWCQRRPTLWAHPKPFMVALASFVSPTGILAGSRGCACAGDGDLDRVSPWGPPKPPPTGPTHCYLSALVLPALLQ